MLLESRNASGMAATPRPARSGVNAPSDSVWRAVDSPPSRRRVRSAARPMPDHRSDVCRQTDREKARERIACGRKNQADESQQCSGRRQFRRQTEGEIRDRGDRVGGRFHPSAVPKRSSGNDLEKCGRGFGVAPVQRWIRARTQGEVDIRKRPQCGRRRAANGVHGQTRVPEK